MTEMLENIEVDIETVQKQIKALKARLKKSPRSTDKKVIYDRLLIYNEMLGELLSEKKELQEYLKECDEN